jgi:hypothetical protein
VTQTSPLDHRHEIPRHSAPRHDLARSLFAQALPDLTRRLVGMTAVTGFERQLVVDSIARATDTLWAEVSGRLVFEEHHSEAPARFVTGFERPSAGWRLAAIHRTASATESPLN